MNAEETSHNQRITRLMESYPEAKNDSVFLHRGNYTLFLSRVHNNVRIELYSGNVTDRQYFIDEPLLNTIPSGSMPQRVLRFKTNWDANHTRLKYDHLLLSMELARIFSILIPEHMPS